MKSEEIKKNNHYVWAHYLRGWAENGRDVYRKTKKGVEPYSVRGVACEPHFYRISPLDDKDVEFIQVWLNKADEQLRDFHYKMLEKMIRLSCAIEVLDREDQAHKRELLLANTLENIHTTIENDFRPILDSLRQGKLSVLNSVENRNNLHSYIGHQWARTKFLRDTFIDSWRYAGDEYVRIAKKTWWFMSLVYGVNIGFNLDRFYHRKNVVWLVNKTSTPFLTSDHPVISVHPSVLDTSSGPPPDHSDFYFPISPTMAYMVNDSDMYGRGVMEATEECVDILNRNMLLRCGQTVFGSTAEVVKNTKRPKPRKA